MGLLSKTWTPCPMARFPSPLGNSTLNLLKGRHGLLRPRLLCCPDHFYTAIVSLDDSGQTRRTVLQKRNVSP